MKDKCREIIEKLINLELDMAIGKYGLHASNHEAYAVILEEFQEAQEELGEVEYSMDDLWSSVREDDNEEFEKVRNLIYERCIFTICETIQLAAMCKKKIR